MIYFEICLCIFLILFILFVIYFSIFIFKSSITRKLRNENESYDFLLKKRVINDDLYKSLKKENIEITSIDNLKLSAMLLLNKKHTNKFIILVH